MLKIFKKTQQDPTLDSTEAPNLSHFTSDESSDEHPYLDADVLRLFQEHESSLSNEDEELDEDELPAEYDDEPVTAPNPYAYFMDADDLPDYDLHAFEETVPANVMVNATDEEPGVGPLTSALFRNPPVDNDMEDSPAPKLESMRKHLLQEKIPAVRRAVHGMEMSKHREILEDLQEKLDRKRMEREFLSDEFNRILGGMKFDSKAYGKNRELADDADLDIMRTKAAIANHMRYTTIGPRALRITAVAKTKCDLRKQKTQARAAV